MLFKADSTTIREKAAAVIAGLQRNASALSALRSRIESRLASQLGTVSASPELARVLELVRAGERALGELAGRVESARFLEDFIAIMGSAAASIGEIKADMDLLVPAAQGALAEMQDTVSLVSAGLSSPEAQQKIIDEAAAAASAELPPAPAQRGASAAAEKELEAELA